MLSIRFQRRGRKNDPAFRLVVTEKRSKPKSGELEILGSYHPKTKETVLRKERILYWISQGAQLSDSAYNLLVSKGVIRGKKRDVSPKKSRSRGNTEASITEIPQEIPANHPEKEVRPAEAEVRSSEAEVRSSEAEVRPSEAEVRPSDEKS